MVPTVPDCGAKLVMDGPAVTASGNVPEVGPPAPFCTATVNAPEPAMVVEPVREAAVFEVSTAFVTVHGAQPGPVITMKALAGTKFAPETVSENGWAAVGVAGTVDKLVRVGMGATASGRVPEIAPVETF